MRAIPFLFVLTLMSSVSHAKNLSCELWDLSRGRILGLKQATINPVATRPILLLMGAGDVMGTVRDFPGKTPEDRRIELELIYSAGSSGGKSHANTTYKLNQTGNHNLLAEVGLNGDFQELSLRCYLRDSTPNMSLNFLMGNTVIENGRGQARGFCSENNAYFCMSDLKRHAKDQAIRDAEFSCQARGGQSRSYGTGSCNDNCSPYSIPHGAGQKLVSCSATCGIFCELP